MAPKRTGHGILGVVDGAGGGVVSCAMTGVCGGIGSAAVVVVVVVGGGGGSGGGGGGGGGDGGGGSDGRRMAPLGKGTTAIGMDCEPGGGPLSVDAVTSRKSQLSPSRNRVVELTPDPHSHLAGSVAVRNANSAT